MYKYPTLEQLKNLDIVPCDAEYTVNGNRLYSDINEDVLLNHWFGIDKPACYSEYQLDRMTVVEYLQGNGRTWISLIDEAH